MRDRRIGIAITAAAALAAGWLVIGSLGSEAPKNTAVAQHVRGRAAVADTSWGPATSFVDLLPATSYRNVETGEEFVLTEAFVIGEVIDAVPGRYFYSQDDDESLPETTEVKASDRRAAWATIHVTVRPTYWSSPEDPAMPQEVTIGIAVGAGAVEEFANELKGFGTVAVPLHRSAVFSYDEQVFSAYIDGSFLATVADDGQLEFPFFPTDSDSRERIDLVGVTTESARAAATEGRVVDVLQFGPLTIRTDDTSTLEARGIDLNAVLAEAGS